MLVTRAKHQFIIGIIGGICLSFLVHTGTRKLILCDSVLDSLQDVTYITNFEKKPISRNSALMLVGVQTAEKYLKTRMKAAHETWAQHIHGDVVFFSGEKSTSYREDINTSVVYLPDVPDNMYPPQKKSFLMLKYMHDYYIDKYDWFVRADDDSFIIGPALGKFLSSINSSKLHYIGQGGEGREDERGQLGLKDNVAYCMGGPGVILSRATLIKLAPNIGYCLQNPITLHEDTELGRCIHKFLGISCTKAAEVWFYQTFIYSFLD